MASFRISFVNHLPDSTGHVHRCVQREIVTRSGAAESAVEIAKREFERLEGTPRWDLRAHFLECQLLG